MIILRTFVAPNIVLVMLAVNRGSSFVSRVFKRGISFSNFPKKVKIVEVIWLKRHHNLE